MTKVSKWVRDLVEYDPCETLCLGMVVKHTDGRQVVITGGQYWGKYGLSNFWNFREVLPDDKLSDTEECGYGNVFDFS
jgi:hypothetical protein